MNWCKVTPTDPKPGTYCLFYGVMYGNYGYTDDEKVLMRGIAKKPKEGRNGELYPQCDITEATGRYWNGFTPELYIEIPDIPLEAS